MGTDEVFLPSMLFAFLCFYSTYISCGKHKFSDDWFHRTVRKKESGRKSKPAEPLKTAYIYKSERHWVEIFRATARIIA